MFVYLIQHARAKSKEEDPERGLTEEGLEEARRCFRFFARTGAGVAEVWHSGKKRAEQTADLLARTLDETPRVAEREGLDPKDDVEATAEALAGVRGDVAVVGHMPHLARLASLLLARDAGREVVRFRNGGVVALVREESDWHLAWMITPEVL